jgi:prolyl-tRNA editing enzyme YbaK/EbsC (Cys-tRNA(Pro) deacylase)
MSKEKVVCFFAQRGLDYPIIEMPQSTATVYLAAEALGVEEARIAKSLALRQKDKNIVLVTCGTARLDNKKYKRVFSCKAKMLSLEETPAATGHPVGGVCPFGLPADVEIYLDKSLKQFDFVFPAAGTPYSAIKITPRDLGEVTSGTWVDVCEEMF